MNRLLLIVSFLFAIMILSDCKKDKPDKSSSETKPDDSTYVVKKFKKVKTRTYSSGSTSTYEYNSDGSISKITQSTKDYYDKTRVLSITTYTYSPDTITAVIINVNSGDINGQGAYTRIEKGVLNSKGYISSLIVSVNGLLSSVTNYEYDNAGYCIKESDSQGNLYNTKESSYYDGNKASYSTYYVGTESRITYAYYDKENTLSFDHYGINFLGKDNRNLVKSDFLKGYIIVRTYIYEFDKDNHVSKMITTTDASSTWETYTYY